MRQCTRTLLQRLSAAYRAVARYQPPYAPHSPYVGPPTAVRYTLERWSAEDQNSNLYAGETYAPTYCIGCYGMHGSYCVGEWYVDDTLSDDTYHTTCAPTLTRVRAYIGVLLCTLRAIIGIDSQRTHPV